jgi:rsbT co-antagonist protein RsbR
MSSQSEVFRIVLDNLDVIAWAVDNDGLILLSEGKQLHNLSLKPGQLVGANAFEVFRNDVELSADIRRALAGEQFVATVPIGDRLVENRYACLRDKNGTIVGAAGVSVDVTESMQAKREIDRQAAALKEQAELLDLAYDAILVRGLDGTITY